MSKRTDNLWRNFPKTAIEFEQRFATEEDCRAYWIAVRWGGKPACARCHSKRVWEENGGTRFECADCGHQTSLTSNTVLEKTRKPLKMWFRAVFEISSRKNGISAKELQRILGFGSYKTAWAWLHKLRSSMVRPDRTRLGQDVEIDEGLIGGKRAGKHMVLVAAQRAGRVRLAHAENNDEKTLQRFADDNVTADTLVTTDGLASYNRRSLGARRHEMVVMKPDQRRKADALQGGCAAKRPLGDVTVETMVAWHAWRCCLLETPASLFRRIRFAHQPPNTNGVARIAARTIEGLIDRPAKTMRQIIDQTLPYSAFRS